MKKKARIISMVLAFQMIIMSAATGVLALDNEMTLSQDQTAAASELTVDELGSEGITEGTEATETEDAAQAADQAQIEQDGEIDASVVAEEGSVTVDATLSGTTATVTVSGDDAAQVAKIKTVKDGVEGEAGVPEEGKLVVSDLSVGSTYVFKAVNSEDAVLGQSAEIKVTGTLPAPKGVVAAPGHKSVTIYWNKVDGATGYEVFRDGKLLKKVNGGDTTSYRDKTVKEGPSGNTGKVNQYKYYVVAVSGSQHSDPSATKTAGKVRSALYKITFKSSAKLTSHDKYKKTLTFKGGQTVYADGFAQGKYQFSYKKGSKTYRFYTMWMRIKNPKGDIKKNAYENGHTAENYVNEGGYSSPTKWLIWVNLYSQRVYVFTGKKGHWKLKQNYLCGSGTPKTPTSSGMNKKLHRKAKHYSKHKWWNMFSGTMAIHGSNGAKEEAKLGHLISNGCVRVTNDQAKWIFDHVSLKTRVLIY